MIILAIFVSIITSANSALLHGLNHSVYVYSKSSEKISMVYIEGCDTPDCKKSKSRSACNFEEGVKWFCHLNELPSYFRFLISIESGQAGSLVFPANGINANLFSLHLEKSEVQAFEIQDMVFEVAMEEMLENVWDEKSITSIRAIKPGGQRNSLIDSSKKFEIMFCENENCEQGLTEKVICPLFSRGISYLAFTCKRSHFSRFAKIKFFAKDKERQSGLFKIESYRYSLSVTSTPSLKLRKFP